MEHCCWDYPIAWGENVGLTWHRVLLVTHSSLFSSSWGTVREDSLTGVTEYTGKGILRCLLTQCSWTSGRSVWSGISGVFAVLWHLSVNISLLCLLSEENKLFRITRLDFWQLSQITEEVAENTAHWLPPPLPSSHPQHTHSQDVTVIIRTNWCNQHRTLVTTGRTSSSQTLVYFANWCPPHVFRPSHVTLHSLQHDITPPDCGMSLI